LAVLRFHRDKRGYEYFSLVEPGGDRQGKSGRLLYWFRTPPNVKLGRAPFDDAMRRAIEAQHPDIRFDWKRILATPIPSAEDEMWRERRRAVKAAKLAASKDDEEHVTNPENPDSTTPSPDASNQENAAEAAAAPSRIRRRRRRRRGSL
jgi:hypothetical protein